MVTTRTSPNQAPGSRRGPPPIRTPKTRGPLPVRFYRSAIGKKWVMAITGVVLMVFLTVHLLGNIKLFLSKQEVNLYSEALRDMPGHLLPRTWLLWTINAGLFLAFVLHVHAAYGLTMINRRARPDRYQSKRDYVAANWASRTMRWTGVIIGFFVIFHLADLTWGNANPQFMRGDAYNNVVYSFQRPAVTGIYMVAMIALGFHLYHGAWSLFQSLGLNNERYNQARRWFATGFAGVIMIGNLLFPIGVQAHWITLLCPHTYPTTAPCNTSSPVKS